MEGGGEGPDAVKELCKLLVIVSGEAAKTCAGKYVFL